MYCEQNKKQRNILKGISCKFTEEYRVKSTLSPGTLIFKIFNYFSIKIQYCKPCPKPMQPAVLLAWLINPEPMLAVALLAWLINPKPMQPVALLAWLIMSVF